MKDIFALKLYTRVARLGSFSAAARECNLSQSQASRIVADLEESLGARLLSRTTRAVVPTEAGYEFLARVEPILDALDEAEQSVREGGELHGTLRIGLPSSIAIREVIPRLPVFAERHVTMPTSDATPAAQAQTKSTSNLVSSAGTGTTPSRGIKSALSVTKRAEHKDSPNFVQFTHTPLIPERILRQYGAYSWSTSDSGPPLDFCNVFGSGITASLPLHHKRTDPKILLQPLVWALSSRSRPLTPGAISSRPPYVNRRGVWMPIGALSA